MILDNQKIVPRFEKQKVLTPAGEAVGAFCLIVIVLMAFAIGFYR